MRNRIFLFLYILLMYRLLNNIYILYVYNGETLQIELRARENVKQNIFYLNNHHICSALFGPHRFPNCRFKSNGKIMTTAKVFIAKNSYKLLYSFTPLVVVWQNAYFILEYYVPTFKGVHLCKFRRNIV